MTAADALALYQRALDSYQRSDIPAAVAHYHAALAADPTFAAASSNLSAIANQYYNLGCTHQSQGRIEAAIDAYRLALSANPGDYEAMFNIALMLDDSGRIGDAIAGYRATLDINPGDHKARLNLVRLLHQSGAAEEASVLIRGLYRDFALSPSQAVSREIEATGFDETAADLLLDGLAIHGVLVLRQLYEPDTIAWLATILERVEARRERDLFPLHDIVETAEMARLVPTSLAAVIGRLSLSRQPSTTSFIRRVGPAAPTTHVRYHQDSLAFGVRCLNIWVPLTECGDDAPGLEVVARRTAELLPTITTDDNPLGRTHAEIDPRTIAALFQPSEIWAPSFAVGDVALQLGTTIHRSYLTPHMTKRRVSIEIRFSE